ncbi:MAG: glycerol-3-phosphate 1-O-acyltransferase PlsY [Synergistaceae bacterium]|nr:glycerol-3-phosphate 1-O-acyltransferase PlsY [Synergistaceae bacterium]
MDKVDLPGIILWMIFGYVMGSCPTGYLLVRVMKGADIRTLGSGNIGATNVGRVLGRKWAIITAVIDISKGGFAILIAILCGVESPTTLSLIGTAGVIGHNYPVWIGFNGGKGVATTYGVFACYDFFNPMPVILGGMVWFLIREFIGYASLASLISLGVTVLLMPLFMEEKVYFVSGVFLTAICVWRHKENIKRLILGTESRVKPVFFRRHGRN